MPIAGEPATLTNLSLQLEITLLVIYIGMNGHFVKLKIYFGRG